MYKNFTYYIFLKINRIEIIWLELELMRSHNIAKEPTVHHSNNSCHLRFILSSLIIRIISGTVIGNVAIE